MSTNEETLEKFRNDALRELRYAAQTLRSELAGAQRDIAHAIVSMEQGNLPAGSRSSGPLGHQRPFDIQKASLKLDAARMLCMGYSATHEQIEEAYAAGVKAGA
jgi:hypothetical protein